MKTHLHPGITQARMRANQVWFQQNQQVRQSMQTGYDRRIGDQDNLSGGRAFVIVLIVVAVVQWLVWEIT